MKKRKCFFSLLLFLVLCFGVVVQSDARASAYLKRYNASITASTAGVVTITYTVVGTEIMDEIGATSITLSACAPNSSTWSVVKTWTPTNTPELVTTNKGSYTYSVSYAGISGYSYQAVIYVKATKNGAGDTRLLVVN